jgi:transposase
VRVGMEATGYSRWFERLLVELRIDVWRGTTAGIKAKRVRKQKTHRQDAEVLLKFPEENRVPRFKDCLHRALKIAVGRVTIPLADNILISMNKHTDLRAYI